MLLLTYVCFFAVDIKVNIDDVVLIVDENAKRNTWAKGIVVDVHKAKDGVVRSAVVKTADGMFTRPVVKLAKLDLVKPQLAQKIYEGGNVGEK